jgi:hypothetical protein
MKHRVVLLLLCALLGGAGSLAAACSSSSSNGFSGSDGSADGSSSDSTSHQDSMAEGGMDRVGMTDTGNPTDSGTIMDGSGGFDGPPANCSPVTGPCDIVSQNCPSGQECDLARASDGGFTTGCVMDQVTQHLPKGHSCCPSGSVNPCDPGLECIGNTCDPDAAAPQTGRCTPHCCLGPDGGDNTPCGMSVPEGYPGHCDLNIGDPNNPTQTLYSVCTYAAGCEPLQVQPCTPGNTCLVSDMQGTASCVQIFNPDGGPGLGEHQHCDFANECADGLMCLTFTTPDGGMLSQCAWLCWTGAPTPFDAGVLNMVPGTGGCPMNENCGSATSIFPAWLGVCF